MPRIHAELAGLGIVASRKRIARLMRENKLAGVSRRRAWCITTQRSKRERPAPDLVKHQFVAQDINQLWVADMTYLPTWQGFIYPAVVVDVFSRKVVGWAFGEQMTADLVVAAHKNGRALLLAQLMYETKIQLTGCFRIRVKSCGLQANVDYHSCTQLRRSKIPTLLRNTGKQRIPRNRKRLCTLAL